MAICSTEMSENKTEIYSLKKKKSRATKTRNSEDIKCQAIFAHTTRMNEDPQAGI